MHSQSYGNDGFPPVDQFNSHDKNHHILQLQPVRNEFRDLFAFVNGAGDKTNYKIFVNGPSNPEMHIACFCPRNKNELENLVHIFLGCEVDDTCGLHDNYVFNSLASLSRGMKLME